MRMEDDKSLPNSKKNFIRGNLFLPLLISIVVAISCFLVLYNELFHKKNLNAFIIIILLPLVSFIFIYLLKASNFISNKKVTFEVFKESKYLLSTLVTSLIFGFSLIFNNKDIINIGLSVLYKPFLVALFIFIMIEIKVIENSFSKVQDSMNKSNQLLIEYTKELAETKDSTTRLLEKMVFDATQTISNEMDKFLINSNNFANQSRELFENILSANNNLQSSINVIPALFKSKLDFNDLSLGLKDLEDRNNLNILLSNSFGNYQKSWINYSSKLNITGNRLHAYAWTKFFETYLDAEQANLTNEIIFTTSKVYTDIVINCCEEVLKLHPSESITLFFATAMLPNELFNWPQSEVSLSNNHFEAIGHTWNGYDNYFSRIQNLINKGVKIRRSVLVTERPNNYLRKDKSLMFIGTVQDLIEDKEKWITREPLNYSDFSTLRSENIFEKTTKIKYEDAEKFVDIDKFTFYPIARYEDFDDNCDIKPQLELMNRYVYGYHSSPEDALYKVISSSENDKHIIDIFFESGSLINSQKTIPELAVIKIGDRWEFGVMGYLKPFSDTIYIKFLSNSNIYKTKLADILVNLERCPQLLDL